MVSRLERRIRKLERVSAAPSVERALLLVHENETVEERRIRNYPNGVPVVVQLLVVKFV